MKMSARTKATAVITACVAAAATVVTATPSSASYSPITLHEHTGYRGYSINLWSSDSNLWNRSFSDATSSVENKSAVAWVLYDDSGYSDRRYCIKPGQTISNLGADAWKFNDKISSVKELGSASCGNYPTF